MVWQRCFSGRIHIYRSRPNVLLVPLPQVDDKLYSKPKTVFARHYRRFEIAYVRAKETNKRRNAHTQTVCFFLWQYTFSSSFFSAPLLWKPYASSVKRAEFFRLSRTKCHVIFSFDMWKCEKKKRTARHLDAIFFPFFQLLHANANIFTLIQPENWNIFFFRSHFLYTPRGVLWIVFHLVLK